jgi:hypothetical protein
MMLKKKTAKEAVGNFTFRIKLAEHEVEINGTRDEVLKTIEDLPNLVTKVSKAFETAKPKTVATLTVKTEAPKEDTLSAKEKYPKILQTENCDEAILRILETDWGKWRPRTVDELRGALKANGLQYSGRVLANVLMGLAKKQKVRRWQTDAGYVYILAEKEALA